MVENGNFDLIKSWQHQECFIRPRAPLSSPIIPDSFSTNILICSALPYVNNIPHLGNIAGSTLSADVFARFCRQCDRRTIYVCGTDEYGTATETKAIQEGLTPEQICEKYHKLHVEVYEWLKISFDIFGRTTTANQTKITQDIFLKLHKNGYISSEVVQQLFCGNCDMFLADRFVEGTCPICSFDDARGDQCDSCGRLMKATELKSPKCKTCNSSPTVRSSNHLFLDLSLLQTKLEKWISGVISTWSGNAVSITQAWLKEGLKKRCISRDLKWGTPIPLDGFRDKVFYVWFDAPIGYISITAAYCDEWELWWKNPEHVRLYNFMAKDNVPFHSVVFPTSLLGTGDPYTFVSTINATEYLNYEGGKFSKSRGVGVFGLDMKKSGIESDYWRFYLMMNRPEGHDSFFIWDDFMTCVNSHLVNNLGNFIHRTLTFCSKYFDGKVGMVEMAMVEEIVSQVDNLLLSFHSNMEHCKFVPAIHDVLSLSRLGNNFIQLRLPWVKVKNPSTKCEAHSCISLMVHVTCLLAYMMFPFIPDTAETLASQLNMNGIISNLCIPTRFLPLFKEGHVIGKPTALFKTIRQIEIESLKGIFGAK